MPRISFTSVDDSFYARGVANGSISKSPIRDKIKDMALLVAGVAATAGVLVVGYNAGVNGFQETITADIIGHAQNVVGMRTGVERIAAAESLAAGRTSDQGLSHKASLLRESYDKAISFAAKRMLVDFSNPAIPDFASPDRISFLPEDLQTVVKSLPLSKQRKIIEAGEDQASLVAAQASYLAIGMAEKISKTFDMKTMTSSQRDKFSDAIANRAVSQSIREMAATRILALTAHDKPATAAQALKDSYNLRASPRP